MLTLLLLIKTIVVIINHSYWEWDVCLSFMILQIFVPKSKNMIYFQPLEVVGRGSETQLHVAEKNK